MKNEKEKGKTKEQRNYYTRQLATTCSPPKLEILVTSIQFFFSFNSKIDIHHNYNPHK